VRRAIRKHLGDFLALIALVLLATGITVYILENQRFRFPLVEEQPQRLKVELSDAQAVRPGQGQTVRVAGVEVGSIGKVELEEGQAVVEIEVEKDYEGLIREDANALLRPKTGLKDMFLEIDPGSGRPLGDGDRIPATNTAPDVDPDEILSALDGDTRDYLRLLISGAGQGLRGRGNDLREVFKRLEPLGRDVTRVQRAVAQRRRNLRTLVHNYGLLMEKLGEQDQDLTRLVTASNDVFDAFAAENQNVSRTVAKLPATLRTTERTLSKVGPFARLLGPTLERLRPPFRQLATANREVLPLARAGAPIVRDEIRPFVRAARPYIGDLKGAAADLAQATPDLTTAFDELNRFFNMAAYNPGGAEGLTGDPQRDRARQEGYLYWLAWVAQNTVSLFNTADAQGVFRRFTAQGLDCNTLAVMGVPAPITNALKAAGVCGG
jgi:phospholipid/cholesterol/gamma-HCH transport system substrate-binding protein